MSVQTNKYTSKKTGKIKTQYYASVWYAKEKRSITGPMRDTKKLAGQDETDIQREIDAGKAKATKKKRSVTIDELYQDWHEATAPPVYANSTWQIYARFYRDYIKDALGPVAASEVKPANIQKYVNLMKTKYSAETVNKCLNIIVDIFNFARDVEKCITSNPADGIKRCKVSKKKKVTWSDEMITYFLSLPEVQKSHYYPMFCLSAALGPRPGEVCGLTEDALQSSPCYSICFDRGYDNWEYETDMKTGDSHRTPPIPKYLHRIMRRKLLWKKRMKLKDKTWGNNDFLFVSQKGNPIKPHQYSTAFKRLLDAHNRQMEESRGEDGKLPGSGQILPYITLYGLRTSFATNNMRRRPNAALISSVMGNSPKTLMQFYTQSDTEMQAELINEYVKPSKVIS